MSRTEATILQLQGKNQENCRDVCPAVVEPLNKYLQSLGL